MARVGNRKARLAGSRAPRVHKRTGASIVARAAGGELPSVQRAVHDLQKSVGNRAVQAALGQLVARREDNSAPKGTALDPAARVKLERSLGADLSLATVHTDGEADKLARSLGANAFTTGSDIYFREGRYDPGSPQGFRLLAHEAAHVVQQDGAAADGPLTVSDPGDASEHEAERVADRVAGGESATVTSQKATAARSVQRDDDGTQQADTPVKDIPFVKFMSDPEIATPNVVSGGDQDFFAIYEIVNMGTAPTTKEDQVWSSGVFSNTVLSQSHRNLDNPQLAANGGSHKGFVRIPARKLFPGDWILEMAVTNAAGKDDDEVRVPFKVLPRESKGGTGASP